MRRSADDGGHWVKQFSLVGDWSLALHSRDDGEWVGAILHANVIQADLLCLVHENQGFATIRVPDPPSTTVAGRDVRSLFAPGRTPIELTLLQALAEVLTREIEGVTQLVLSPVKETDPEHFIVLPR
jgi:hypothetical protein